MKTEQRFTLIAELIEDIQHKNIEHQEEMEKLFEELDIELEKLKQDIS